MRDCAEGVSGSVVSEGVHSACEVCVEKECVQRCSVYKWCAHKGCARDCVEGVRECSV